MPAATRSDVAGMLGVATQARMALTDLGQLVLGMDDVEHGGAFRWLVGGGGARGERVVEWRGATMCACDAPSRAARSRRTG